MYKPVDGNNVSYRQNKSQGCCCRHAVTILFCCGLILLTAGVICAITNVFEEWVKDEIRDGVKLKEGNEVYDRWLHPENPVYLTFYMFNVTNAENVSKGGIPNVQQHGPYTYRVVYNNTIVGRNKYSTGSITYTNQKHHVFEKELSCQNCDPYRNSVTNVNLPFLTTLKLIINYIKMKDPKSLSFALGVMDDMFIKLDLQDFHTHTVHELLWGYKDTALTKAHSILIGLAKSRDPAFNIELPEKFALQQNMSSTLYTVDSGENDVDNVGKFLLWNNKSNISCWSDEYAGMINGSGGLHYKPFLSKDDIIYALVTPVYRSFTLIYDSIVHYRGIRLYRFALDPKQFVISDGNNKGFCVTGKERKCLPNGVMDLSYCDPSHVPVVGSLPHFYMGNKSLLNTVHGLNPKKDLHATFLDIEPHTGITMRGRRRMQLNANLRHIEGITAFQYTATAYVPILFANKHAQISEEDAEDFENDVLLPLRLSKAAPFVLLGLGAILLFIAGIISYRRHQRKDSTNKEKIPLLISSSHTYSGT